VTKPPIDDLNNGRRFALRGRVITMNASFRVLDPGVVYIDQGRIIAVRAPSDAAPAEFAGLAVIDTRGTILPGLIELHNHLSYNALPLWDVPRKFDNRGEWGSIAEYAKRISAPMRVLANSPGLLPAITRYAECKCLVAGVTTSQGIKLVNQGGIGRFYRGLVRNVEQTDDVALPESEARIGDVPASDYSSFFAHVRRSGHYLLHLSEGIDEDSRDHFAALNGPQGWALDHEFAGIHCAALKQQDFRVLARHGASMVWSPLSNLLLYGKTADVGAAKKEGVRIALGSDWSPTGSKNLLGEMKVARLVSADGGGIFSDREIVAMATRTAAAIIGWQDVLGSLAAGRYADLLVIAGQSGDPYDAILHATEASVRLVVVSGIPRYGVANLMERLGVGDDRVTVGGTGRRLFLEQATVDPAVTPMTLTKARMMLRDALNELPALAKKIDRAAARPRRAAARMRTGPEPVVWALALDELGGTGVELRPRLPLPGLRAATGPRVAAAPSRPVADVVQPVKLDKLTVVDDPAFLKSITTQRNLPDFVKRGLPRLY